MRFPTGRLFTAINKKGLGLFDLSALTTHTLRTQLNPRGQFDHASSNTHVRHKNDEAVGNLSRASRLCRG
jgi:hypothetical protein